MLQEYVAIRQDDGKYAVVRGELIGVVDVLQVPTYLRVEMAVNKVVQEDRAKLRDELGEVGDPVGRA